VTHKAGLLTGLLLIVIGLSPMSAFAQWQPDPQARAQVKSAETIQRFRDRVPATSLYIDDAYAYAVWPTIGRAGFGFGGAFGRGIVIRGDEALGLTSYWQFSSGIQAGAKAFSMMIFFKDEAALEHFQTGAFELMGQAGIDVATVGVSGTPAYSEGVAVLAMTRFGLMGEFTISGVKFRYKPLEADSR